MTFFYQFGLGPMGNLSNITLHPRDMNLHLKKGLKKFLSKKRFIFQRFSRTEATAKILGRWDF